MKIMAIIMVISTFLCISGCATVKVPISPWIETGEDLTFFKKGPDGQLIYKDMKQTKKSKVSNSVFGKE